MFLYTEACFVQRRMTKYNKSLFGTSLIISIPFSLVPFSIVVDKKLSDRLHCFYWNLYMLKLTEALA